jgi:hypothetical protein
MQNISRIFFRFSSRLRAFASSRSLRLDIGLLATILLLLNTVTCHATWFDSAWQYRRPMSIIWDDQNPSGEDLATAVFYTDGHALPNGEDVRVATEDGKQVASHVLMVGPGDRLRIVFSLQKNVRNYDIYFGNPKPEKAPAGLDDVHYKSGLLIETRQWTGGQLDNFTQMEQSWQRSTPVLGKMMVDGVFLGYNPFGPQEQWISKFTGSLFAPQDGEYLFAMAADDDAALYLDGRQTLFAPLGGGDIRYHTIVHLTRGRHDVMVYHVNKSQTGYVSLGWRPPDASKVTVINHESFGICYSGLVGLMEEHKKGLVADFNINQSAECFFNDSYSFHYKFSTKSKIEGVRYEWDFGDGQTATGEEVDHVYLVDGIYPVKLVARIRENSDTQTCQLPVSRNYAHIIDVRQEQPEFLADVVHGYRIDVIPADSLQRALELNIAATRLDDAVKFADKVAAMKSHPQADAALAALTALEKKLLDAAKVDQAVEIWDRVPTDSDLQPRAARHAAELALWWTGDFDKAIKLLKPHQDHPDFITKMLYGQALVLSGDADQGRKILESLGSSVPQNRKAALSGAAARSVEFFITEKDIESGEEAWDRWQTRFPTDFLEGYSVMLRTRLMELRVRPDAAAKIAEAFAAAEPSSPYAPQLLDRASKLLVFADPAKSQALHQLLKQKYPEDPLSQ